MWNTSNGFNFRNSQKPFKTGTQGRPGWLTKPGNTCHGQKRGVTYKPGGCFTGLPNKLALGAISKEQLKKCLNNNGAVGTMADFPQRTPLKDTAITDV